MNSDRLETERNVAGAAFVESNLVDRPAAKTGVLIMETENRMRQPCTERTQPTMDFPLGSTETSETSMTLPGNRKGADDLMSSNGSFGLVSETALSKHPHRCSQV